MSFPPPWSDYGMHKTQAMMNTEDSGIGSSESGSTTGRISSARGSNDSALGSMSSHRNSPMSFPPPWSDYNMMYKAQAMMNGEDSGIGSSESGSRASRSSSARGSNDSALGSWMSSRTSGQSSNGYPDSVSSSRRSSLSSVRSDDSTVTLRSDMTATSAKSDRTSVSSTSYQQQGFRHVGQSTTGTYSTSGSTRVGSPYSYGQSGQTRTINTQPPSAIIQIQVQDFNGRTHMVNLRLTDKVRDLRNNIEEKLKSTMSIASCQTLDFYMTFQGKRLDDKLTLSLESLGMQNLSNVFVNGRLKGGALCK